MCRLLAFIAPQPATLEELLGAPGLAAFTALGRIHGDGWGASWGSSHNPAPEHIRSTLAADQCPAWAEFGVGSRADAGIVHLRWASAGLAVQALNTHPFIADGLAFAHNGAILPADSLDDLLSEEWLAEVRGTTDSERYFALVRQELALLAEDVDPGDAEPALGPSAGQALGALSAAISRVRTRVPQASGLNALLLTPHDVIAVCSYAPDLLAANELAEDYFVLWYSSDERGTVVTSTQWPRPLDRTWHPLHNGEALVMSRSTGGVRVETLELERPGDLVGRAGRTEG